MSKKTNYRLLSSMLVSGLHPNEPIVGGTIFAPDREGGPLDMEGKALVDQGYAEFTDEKPTWAGTTLDSHKTHLSGLVPNDDAAYNELLKGKVAEIEVGLENGTYTVEQLERIKTLNLTGENPRDGVDKAVDKAIAALTAQ